MTLDSYLVFQEPETGKPEERLDLSFMPDTARILSRKLEVMTLLIVERLQIQSRNVSAIDGNRESLLETLQRVDRAALYHLREHSEKGILYARLFELESERRKESVECWRDIVLVMRDWLLTWDYHEQAKARSRFLHDLRK